MPQITNFPRVENKTYKQPQVINEPPKKKLSTATKTCVATGAVALAASGIYLVNRGKSQTVEKVFKNLTKADSIMHSLKDVKLSPKNFKTLMFKLTKDEAMSEKFINEAISNPRKSKENVRMLNKKIGGDKELMDWMLRPNGYQDAYTKYTQKIYDEAKTPDDLIKISPNWNIWKMKEKFKDDFVFGELPKDICGGNVDSLRNAFKDALFNPHAGFETQGIKFGEYINGGMSGKAVRTIEAGGKKYIVKFQHDIANIDLNENLSSLSDSNYLKFQHDRISDMKDNISMKSDSAFLNSQLDRFLDMNGFTQGAKFKFFDYKTNMALYEMTEGVKPTAEMVTDILKTNESLKDLNSLGVYYNDIGQNNFLVDNSNKLTFIDSGESSFVDFFKPGVAGYHFALPNLNGRSITDTAAAINLAK